MLLRVTEAMLTTNSANMTRMEWICGFEFRRKRIKPKKRQRKIWEKLGCFV